MQENIIKTDLIAQITGFHEQIYGLINDYGFENWLSLDISIGQLKSLIYIRSRGKASHSELSKVLRVTPSVVTGIISRLKSSGLVLKQPDVDDRRVHWLALTDKGNGIFNQFSQNSKKEIGQVLDTLSQSDLEKLVGSFSCLLTAYKKHLDKTGPVPISSRD